MKLGALLLVAAVGVAAYFIVKGGLRFGSPAPQSATASQTGGAQTAAPQDQFVATVGAIQSVFDTIGKFAQTAPKSH